MANTFLSKSSYLKGLQCHKYLWLYKNQPALMDPVDASQEAIFASGHKVGELATQLFPGGQMLPCDELSYRQQVETTQAWLEQGVETIYEAAFSVNGVFARVDILRKGPDGWQIYEVKSSTQVKDVYVHDVAVQTWILKQAGLNVSKAALVILNKTYHRQGDLDIVKLFAIHDLTQTVNERQRFVQDEINGMRAMLAGDALPEVPVGAHCEHPYRCAFFTQCHGEIAADSVFRIADTGRPDPYALFHRGQKRFAEVPLDDLNWRQRLQVESSLNQSNQVDAAAVRGFLSDLWYPLCHLDFETTYLVAIPMFDGTRPYQQVPFQFSLHIQREAGGPVEHVEFLAEPGSDPRPELLERLFSVIPEGACVLAYNKGFEGRCLRETVRCFPEYAKRADALIGSLRDLMVLFRRKEVYFWQMNGSYSLKEVLPALLPEMGYADLEIAEGGAAASAYLRMWESQDPDEIADIRRHLLRYCERDTFAMVKLLDKLHELAGQ